MDWLISVGVGVIIACSIAAILWWYEMKKIRIQSNGDNTAPVEVLVALLETQLEAWRDGSITTYEAACLIRRSVRHLNRACWCELHACCSLHEKHVEPHRNCALR